MIIGVTGHQTLPGESSWTWVRRTLASLLAGAPPPWSGISSLAAGADQLFAELALGLGAELHVVVPFAAYESAFANAEERERYLTLLAHARSVEVCAERTTAEESFLAAGQRMVDRADRLIAVWNGAPARGLGGTADIVAYAMQRGIDVLHVNPSSREVVRMHGAPNTGASRPAAYGERP